MKARSDAIPDVAGGEGGHGAAKPDGVIHSCTYLTDRKAGTTFRERYRIKRLNVLTTID
jgi:hypothetical protein